MRTIAAVIRIHVGRLVAIACLCLFASACTQEIIVRGNVPDQEEIASIEPGLTTRSEVAQILGSPSTVSSFRDRTWYYIGQKQTQFAFLDPDVLERNVLVVEFNASGTVEETRTFTLEDGQSIETVSRVTPTEGRSFTLLEQLLGNVGRFNDPGSGDGNPAPGVPGL
ncbi:MAG: outer membrane protein assembly factor BamE [Pseudomonadota bacterium]